MHSCLGEATEALGGTLQVSLALRIVLCIHSDTSLIRFQGFAKADCVR